MDCDRLRTAHPEAIKKAKPLPQVPGSLRRTGKVAPFCMQKGSIGAQIAPFGSQNGPFGAQNAAIGKQI